jgi:hypothetical protein
MDQEDLIYYWDVELMGGRHVVRPSQLRSPPGLFSDFGISGGISL